MIIEFFGPSGSGKTTIARELSISTGWKYISVNSKKEKLKYIIIFLSRIPARFLFLFIKTILEGRHSFRLLRHKIHLLGEYIARSEKARIESKNEKVILDEGLTQYGLSLYEHNISEKSVYRYINKFAHRDNKINIVISCGDADRIDRMEKRKRFPRAYIGIENEVWQKIISENTKIFTEILVKRGALFFDSSKDISQKIVDAIVQEIK
jgi:hypothetical protein